MNVELQSLGCNLGSYIQEGKISEIEKILKAGIGVNSLTYKNTSILHFAVSNGNISVIEYLIHYGAELNKTDKISEATPLFNAVSEDKIDIVKLLLRFGANVNLIQLWSGWSPLMAACYNGSIELARLLLDSGAKADYCNRYNETPLLIASRHNETEIMRTILKRSKEIKSENILQHALFEAVIRKSKDAVSILITTGVDVNFSVDHCTLLQAACSSNSVEIVTMLLAAGNKQKYSMEYPFLPYECKEEIKRVLSTAGVNYKH